MKNYLLALLIIGFAGCTSKDDYLLFNQTKIHQNTVKQNHKNNQEKKEGSQISQETITQLEQVEFEYKIQSHDRVSVLVYKHPDLSTSTINTLQQERGLLVNSRGEIRMPLIKSLHLEGLTQTEAETALETALAVYIKQPDVQVEVLNKRAYIIGEVKRPGEIQLDNERLSLLQIIAKAGDLTDQANRKSILILRGQSNSQIKTEVVNLTDVHSLKTANLMIKPNDIVYVTPNSMKAFNTAVNEIDPIFSLIGHVLAPFVSMKFLTK